MNPLLPIELLAPAGDAEKLEIAVQYGADAVYLAGKEFSLRNFSGNFSLDELAGAVNFAQGRGVKVYVACNIFARNQDRQPLETYLNHLGDIRPDAIIIADPGVLAMARTLIPNVPIHLSTQANTTSWQSAEFWFEQGVKRINTARELTLDDIGEIAANCPVEIEAFLHGAMCISYSGRCLLSSYLSGRDSNRGMCSHPCRWNYAVVEEMRPGRYMPIAEDDRGTYIFNAKDLCMVEHLPAMLNAGITSLKIEGRMKGVHYLATVLNVYRAALDACLNAPDTYAADPAWLTDLNRISHRGYSNGFYFGDPEQTSPHLSDQKCTPNYRFAGKVLDTVDGHRVRLQIRNKLFTNDRVEVVSPGVFGQTDRLLTLTDQDGSPLEFAQPGSTVVAEFNRVYRTNDLIRRNGEA
jgi:putative protease